MWLLKRFYFIVHWILFSFKLSSFSITETNSSIVRCPVKVCSPEAAAEMWRVMFLENVVGLLECYQAVCHRVISQSGVCSCGDFSWDVPYYWVSKLRISRLMSWVVNTKHCAPEDVLSEFRDETLLLSSIQKTSHSSFRLCVFDEGLQSWGMPGGNCTLHLLLPSCCICTASELPSTRNWAARHIDCSCEFVDCILSAMAICWSSQRSRTSCLLSFLLSASYQHRENIPIYLFFSALKLDHSTHDCVQ